MTTASQATPPKSRFRRFLSALWRLFRILLAIALGLLLGVGLWFGGQTAYQTIVLPLNDTIARVTELEAALQEERDNLTTELAARDDRFTTIESDLTAQQGELESLSTLPADTETLEEALATANAELETLNENLSDLQADITTLSEAIESLSDRTDAHTDDLALVDSQLGELQESSEAAAQILAQTEFDLVLFNVQANLLNAQRELDRRNVGAATAYLQRGRTALKVVIDSADESKQADLAILLTRMEQAFDRLESDPFTAQADLQSAWRVLDSLVRQDLSLPLIEEIEEEETADDAGMEDADAEDNADATDEAGAADEASETEEDEPSETEEDDASETEEDSAP